jgi:endonuclease-3 related protein
VKFLNFFKNLRKKYRISKSQWSFWCKERKTEREREKIIMEAILTQRTNWKNVELAIKNLKEARIKSLKDICQLGVGKLSSLIKPSGFYKAKAEYLFGLSKFIIKNYGSLKEMRKENLQTLRKKLLGLKGIGPETADSILLYALDKPIFVIDEYTKRFVKKHRLAKKTNYAFLQNLFEKNLPRDVSLYQDFHALIVIDGRTKN